MTVYEVPWFPVDRWDDDSPYRHDAPGEFCTIVHHGHRVAFEPTSLVGFNSGRPRTRVVCVTCALELHEATTGPRACATVHWDEVAHGR